MDGDLGESFSLLYSSQKKSRALCRTRTEYAMGQARARPRTQINEDLYKDIDADEDMCDQKHDEYGDDLLSEVSTGRGVSAEMTVPFSGGYATNRTSNLSKSSRSTRSTGRFSADQLETASFSSFPRGSKGRTTPTSERRSFVTSASSMMDTPTAFSSEDWEVLTPLESASSGRIHRNERPTAGTATEARVFRNGASLVETATASWHSLLEENDHDHQTDDMEPLIGGLPHGNETHHRDDVPSEVCDGQNGSTETPLPIASDMVAEAVHRRSSTCASQQAASENRPAFRNSSDYSSSPAAYSSEASATKEESALDRRHPFETRESDGSPQLQPAPPTSCKPSRPALHRRFTCTSSSAEAQPEHV